MAILVVKALSLALGDPPRELLSGIDLTLRSGSITLLLGPNGCGKSLLLRTILGLVPRASGEITLQGQSLRRSFRDLHRLSGVVFQNPDQQLFGNTVREDLLIGTPRMEEPDGELIQVLGLTDLLDRSPAELSGGQRRRLAIAGALAPDPKLLFLDEPFIELDYPSIQRLLMRLDTMRKGGCTIILASHESQDIWPLVDHLVILRNGTIIYQGVPEAGRRLVGPENGLRPLSNDPLSNAPPAPGGATS
ncbi:MAG: ABC transporter ATP-binding protein [Spirochaetaceae bacterium]|nr:MAG: ABC transporter ATP-binding protein [Spirochaetaceae bacterium]